MEDRFSAADLQLRRNSRRDLGSLQLRRNAAGGPRWPASTTEAVAQHSLQHHFANMEQQRESTTLGMWIFLVTEIMFFGGLFTAYLVYRAAASRRVGVRQPAHGVLARHHQHRHPAVPVQFTVALSVHAAQLGHTKITAILLFITVLMGFGFLGIKAVEYHNH